MYPSINFGTGVTIDHFVPIDIDKLRELITLKDKNSKLLVTGANKLNYRLVRHGTYIKIDDKPSVNFTTGIGIPFEYEVPFTNIVNGYYNVKIDVKAQSSDWQLVEQSPDGSRRTITTGETSSNFTAQGKEYYMRKPI